MFISQFGIDLVVGADRIIADVRGVGAINLIGSPALVDTFIERIGGGMGMIGAIATVRDKISIGSSMSR
jgi:hypothetical protein